MSCRVPASWSRPPAVHLNSLGPSSGCAAQGRSLSVPAHGLMHCWNLQLAASSGRGRGVPRGLELRLLPSQHRTQLAGLLAAVVQVDMLRVHCSKQLRMPRRPCMRDNSTGSSSTTR